MGRDHEVRWAVRTVLPHEQLEHSPQSSVIHWPGNFGQQDIDDHVTACGGWALEALSSHSRFYVSRGIQGATAKDILWLMAFCDRKLAEIYQGIWLQ